MTEYIDTIRFKELREQYTDPGDIIVIDTETTGLEHFDDLLSIAILDANTKEEIFSSYLWPHGKRYWKDAERVNHISYDMVRDAPSIQQVRDEIQEIINKAKILISYNGSFDTGFLEGAGLNIDVQYQVDVMMEYAEYFGEWNDYWQSFTWQKLTTASFTCGIEHDAHDAMGDCKATIGVLEYMIDHPDYWTEHKKVYELKCSERNTARSIMQFIEKYGSITYDGLLNHWYGCDVRSVISKMMEKGTIIDVDGAYTIPGKPT